MKKPNRYYSVVTLDKLDGNKKIVLTRAYSATEAVLRACNERGLSVNKIYQVVVTQLSEGAFKTIYNDYEVI